MPNVMQRSIPAQAYKQQLMLQTASLPPDVREYIQAEYGDSQITVMPTPYWSTVRFQASRAAGPPVTFTIDTTERRAFSYAVGGVPSAAGFLAAYGVATPAETNLLNPSQTRNNADYWIWGCSMWLSSDSEPALARRIWRDVDVLLALNGDQNIPLGTMELFPGAGGLYGTGVSFVKRPALEVGGAVDNGPGAVLPILQNGNPMAGNFFRFNQPWKWAGIGSQGSDSSLIMTFTPRRTIIETAGLARAAAPGIEAFTPPAAAGDLGTFVDVRVHLHGVGVLKRSVNV